MSSWQVAYSPVAAPQVLFGSTPTFPTIDRVWEVIERYKVRIKSCRVMS